MTKAQLPIFEAMNQKIQLLMKSIYPSVMDSKQVVNLSDGGVGFNENFEVKTQNSYGYVMFILDNWPVPLFIVYGPKIKRMHLK